MPEPSEQGERNIREQQEGAARARIDQRWPWFRSTNFGRYVMSRPLDKKTGKLEELTQWERNLAALATSPKDFLRCMLDQVKDDVLREKLPGLISPERRYGNMFADRSSIRNEFSRALTEIVHETADFATVEERDGDAAVDRCTNEVVRRVWMELDGKAWEKASQELHAALAAGNVMTFDDLFTLEAQQPSLLPLLLRPPYGEEPDIGKDLYGLGRGRLTFREEGGMLVLEKQNADRNGRYLLYPPGLSRDALIGITSSYLKATGPLVIAHEIFIPEAFFDLGIRLPTYEPPRYDVRHRLRVWAEGDAIAYEIFERENEEATEERRVIHSTVLPSIADVP